MVHNDNSVNMAKQTYHHGDLRAALIAAGLRLLAERDAEALSLREVASSVGVSATSVYRHFPDKKALMAALAREGLARFGVIEHEVVQAGGGGRAGLVAAGRAYIRFALANPALFRLIFASSALARKDGEPSEAARLLKANAPSFAGAMPEGSDEYVFELQAWAIVHGLAMLMLDGQIPADEGLVERAIR